MEKKCGIYQILNKIDGKFYIGSTKYSFYSRWNRHKNDLRKNVHTNDHLQNAWNKYGEENFYFFVIEERNEDNLIEREQYWIDNTNCCDRNIGYNKNNKANLPPIGINKGSFKKGIVPWNKGKKGVYSEETLEKMRNVEFSIESRNKMSVSAKNRPSISIETRKKMSKARSGEGNLQAKLNWEIVKKIRKKYIPFIVSLPKLAKEFNVSISTIYNIVTYKSWKEEEKVSE